MRELETRRSNKAGPGVADWSVGQLINNRKHKLDGVVEAREKTKHFKSESSISDTTVGAVNGSVPLLDIQIDEETVILKNGKTATCSQDTSRNNTNNKSLGHINENKSVSQCGKHIVPNFSINSSIDCPSSITSHSENDESSGNHILVCKGHTAGYDAFMTGFVFACNLSSLGQISDSSVNFQDPKEIGTRESIGKVYLVGKEFPFLIGKSTYNPGTSSMNDKLLRRIRTFS